ncbi:MAG: hypothetical protein JRN45_00750 [Nitrososphaerota archaeon]|nr:hypothetical protein [Nitrososphaerota archaeon]
MTPIEERVLLLLREGDKRYTEIVKAAGHPDKVVWGALTRLREEKFIGLKRRGVYGLTQGGAALLQGAPYALYKLQLEVRIAGGCFDRHVGYVRRGASHSPTPHAVDSFSISSLVDALHVLFDEVVGSLRIETIDLPRAWGCDLEPPLTTTTMDHYFAHLASHLANIRRFSSALQGQDPVLEKAAEVSDEFVKKAEAALARLREGWKERAFDNIISS